MLTREEILKEKPIDCDGHVLEPPDMWQRYIEPRYRDRAVRIVPTGNGDDVLLIDGKPSKQVGSAMLGAFGGMERWATDPRDLEKANAAGRQYTKERLAKGLAGWEMLDGGEARRSYKEGCAKGAMDPKERLQVMDEQGLAISILYPTIGLCWEADMEDSVLAAAHCEAYNRWIADFCRDSGGRLVPIAHIALAEPELAVKEVERAVKDGCKGIMFPPFVLNRKPHGHPDHNRVFAAAQDLGIPISLHPGHVPVPFLWHYRFKGLESVPWYVDLMAPLEIQPALSTFFQFGVFDEFPELKLVVLESGAGWLGWWLDRADGLYRTVLGGSVPLKEPPSYYFKRQCFISADPEETCVAPLTKIIGEDKFFWASDYPHPDRMGHFIDQLCTMTDGMTPAAQRKILKENVAKVYGL